MDDSTTTTETPITTPDAYMITTFLSGPMVLALDFDEKHPSFRGPGILPTIFTNVEDAFSALYQTGSHKDSQILRNATLWNLNGNHRIASDLRNFNQEEV